MSGNVTIDAEVLADALRGDAAALAQAWAAIAGTDPADTVDGRAVEAGDGARSGRVREVGATSDPSREATSFAPGTVRFGRVVE